MNYLETKIGLGIIICIINQREIFILFLSGSQVVIVIFSLSKKNYALRHFFFGLCFNVELSFMSCYKSHLISIFT